MSTDTPPNNDGPGWHLKKEIQLGHLITTFTVAIAAMGYINKIDQRVALLEQAASVQHERDVQQDAATREAMSLLRAQLSRMDDKLDRLLETKGARK